MYRISLLSSEPKFEQVSDFIDIKSGKIIWLLIGESCSNLQRKGLVDASINEELLIESAPAPVTQML